MNAPIRYFGGKGMMYNNILEHFPPEGSYDTYIEPFGGSFSIGIKNNISPIEIYNDLEQNVYSLFKVLSNKELFDKFKEKCDLCYYIEDQRIEYKNILKNNKNLNIVDRAFYFYYVNRTSYSGVGGFSVNTVIRRNMSKSVSDFLSSIDRLPELHQRLSNLIVLNTDGIELINKYNKINVFIYADPPYEQSTRTEARYIIDMNKNEHLKFLDAAINFKGKLLISGYDCELYNVLTDYNFEKFNFNVKTIDGKRNPDEKIETLWKNY